jgi:hypothetical protein
MRGLIAAAIVSGSTLCALEQAAGQEVRAPVGWRLLSRFRTSAQHSRFVVDFECAMKRVCNSQGWPRSPEFARWRSSLTENPN